MGMGIDRPKLYISFPTILSSKPFDSYSWRIADISISSVLNLFAVSAYYGIWTGLDDIFAQTDVTKDGLTLSGTICVILGFACGCIVFIGQFLFVWLYYRHKISNEIPRLTKLQKFMRLLGYNFLLIVALFGSAASFRGFWILIDLYFLPSKLSFEFWRENSHSSLFLGDVVASRLISQFVGMFYMFMFYSGTSLHGGVVRDNENVMIPNFFLTYLLCNKE